MTNPIIGQDAPTPLPELFEMFPEIPRTMIIKMDVINWGLRYTPILNWIGKWTIPVGSMGYSNFPDEMKEGRVERSQEEANLFNIPQFLEFRDGIRLQILVKKDAPYEIRYEGDGTYMLYWNDMAVEEVLFIPRPSWLSKTLKDGTPVPLVAVPAGDADT